MSNGSEVITDSREYDAWGLTIASSGSGSPFGFVGGQGYQKDPDSGLMLLGARYYDPSVGRFISRDPIRYAGGFNLYGYCGNNPVNAADPSGHLAIGFTLNFAFALGLGEAGWSGFGDVWVEQEIGGNWGTYIGADIGHGSGLGIIGSAGLGLQLDTSNLTNPDGTSVGDSNGETGAGGLGGGSGSGFTVGGCGPVDVPPTVFTLSWIGPTYGIGAYKGEQLSWTNHVPSPGPLELPLDSYTYM